MNRSQIRLRAMATVCAGSLALGLTACGEPEVPATEHLSASKHLSWAGEKLLPEWAAATDVEYTPFGDIPKAASELPDSYRVFRSGNVGLELDEGPYIPGSSALFSKLKNTALDPGTGMVYEVNPLTVELAGGEKKTTDWVTVMKDGAPKAIGLFQWDEAATGLKSSSSGVRIAQVDLRSGNVDSEAEVDSLIVQEDNYRIVGVDGERAYFTASTSSRSDYTLDVVAVDIATGEEVAYEKIDRVSGEYGGADFYPIMTGEGMLVYYPLADKELRVRNITTGSDDSVRGNFEYVAVFPFHDAALAFGIDSDEKERCEDDSRAQACGHLMLTLNGADVTHELPYDSSPRFSRGYKPFVVGDIVTLNNDFNSGITVFDAAAGTELFRLSEEEQRDLNIYEAISDGKSIFTRHGETKISESDIATRELIDEDASVFPVSAPSGARAWKVHEEETSYRQVLVAKEDLGKF